MDMIGTYTVKINYNDCQLFKARKVFEELTNGRERAERAH